MAQKGQAQRRVGRGESRGGARAVRADEGHALALAELV